MRRNRDDGAHGGREGMLAGNMAQRLDGGERYRLQFTVYGLRFTVYRLQLPVYSLRFKVYCLLFTVYF